MADIEARMRQLIGTIPQWAGDDLVIADGEIAVEKTGEGDVRVKIGNGVDAYSELPYFAPQRLREWEDATSEITLNTDHLNGAFEVTIVVQCKFVSNTGMVTITVDGVQVATAANGGNGEMWQTLRINVPQESYFRINASNMDQVTVRRLKVVDVIAGIGGSITGGGTFPDRKLVFNSQVSAYNGAAFNSQLPNWPGLTPSGISQTPIYSTLNKVTQIPREVRRAASGAANDVGWGFSVSSVNPNAVMFPNAVGDSGFEVKIIGGIDANVSSAGTTDFMLGIQGGNPTGNPVPANGTPLTTTQSEWFGLYSEAGSGPFIGYKHGSGSVTPLTSALPLTWGAYQGWRLRIKCDPSDLKTYWTLEELSAPGEWTVVSEGDTAAFAPGRSPFASNFRARKTTSGDVLDLWITSLIVEIFNLGTGSL